MIKRVAEIMKENPVTIEQSASLEKLVKIIKQEGYSHVPVTDHGILVGTVSKTDLVNRFLKMLDETTGKHYTKMLMEHVSVSEIMHKDPVTVRRGDDVNFAAELLLQGEFHGLIVVSDEHKVQGVITAYDLLKSMDSVSAE